MLSNKKGECTRSLMNKSQESAISSVSATGCLQTEPRTVQHRNASSFLRASAFAMSIGGPFFEERSSLRQEPVQDLACWSLRSSKEVMKLVLLLHL